MKRIRFNRVLVAVCLLLLCACAKAIRPGAVDVADSRAFDVLGTAAVSIQALKEKCPSGPTSPCPQSEKDAINHIIDAYNVARQAWLDYRALVIAGKPSSSQQLADAVSKVIVATDEYRRLVR